MKGISNDNSIAPPIYMLSLLSKITVNFPLSEFLRIPKHKSKVIVWAKGVDSKINHDYNTNQIPNEPKKN